MNSDEQLSKPTRRAIAEYPRFKLLSAAREMAPPPPGIRRHQTQGPVYVVLHALGYQRAELTKMLGPNPVAFAREPPRVVAAAAKEGERGITAWGITDTQPPGVHRSYPYPSHNARRPLSLQALDTFLLLSGTDTPHVSRPVVGPGIRFVASGADRMNT